MESPQINIKMQEALDKTMRGKKLEIKAWAVLSIIPPHSGDSNWVLCVCEKDIGSRYVVGPEMAIAICVIP